jgi:hypothetical protein
MGPALAEPTESTVGHLGPDGIERSLLLAVVTGSRFSSSLPLL